MIPHPLLPGQSLIPVSSADRRLSALPMPFRKVPEALYAVLRGMDTPDLEGVGEILGIGPETVTAELVFAELTAEDVEPDLVRDVVEEAVWRVRDVLLGMSDELVSPDGSIRSLGRRGMQTRLQNALAMLHEGAVNYRIFLLMVGMIACDPSPNCLDVLQRFRADLRRVIDHHDPDTVRISVPGHPLPVPLDQLAEAIQRMERKRDAQEKRALRAEKRAEGLAAALKRTRPPSFRERASSAGPVAAEHLSALRDAAQRVANADPPASKSPPPAVTRTDEDLLDEMTRLQDALANERRLRQGLEAELESLLQAELAQDQLSDATSHRSVTGLRVVVAGKLDKIQDAAQRAVRELGAEFIHADPDELGAARERVRSADILVVETRHISHSAYYALRDAARIRGIPLLHWTERSPESLVRVLSTRPERG